MTSPGNALAVLAAACGVDTEYWGWQGEKVVVRDDTLRAVLGALGLDVRDGPSCARELDRLRAAGESRPLPPYVVTTPGRATSVPARAERVTLAREDGAQDELTPADGHVRLPEDLTVGYHRLIAAGVECAVIVTPGRMTIPAGLAERPGWGLAAQLYSVRSRASWGVGDLGDLSALARWAATQHGADFVLVNPLHAAEVVTPMNPSPYLPTSRRFANPLYLRVEDVAEYTSLDAAARDAVDELGAAVRASAAAEDLVDRDAAWVAKRSALHRVHQVRRTAEREAAFDTYRAREARTLHDFATWCVLSEAHGSDISSWPSELRDPRSDAVARFADEHDDDVGFHCWLQWLLDEQLAAAQDAAVTAGMRLGVVHDLAVGVSPTGADAWSWQRELATSVTVGAPPDAYSQLGQDWDQPPWRPDRLAELGYAPFRDLFATALRHSGGLRVDHVIGLFRLWWIPRGADALEGTYVHYDHDALIGTLMIEAERAGAVLVGEDLGNVEPWVRDYLRERNILGTSILWFETDGGVPRPAEQWRELCLASVTTHDLPPTTGYLAGDHVTLRHELGLLTRTYDEELAHDRADQQAWLDVLRRDGLLAEGDHDPQRVVLALHRALRRAPSLLRCVALTDAVGDRRTQNQPGTSQAQYPNWRLPLSGPDGTPILLENLVTDPRAAALAATMTGND